MGLGRQARTIPHGTCTNSKELKLFILILKVKLLLLSHHDEHFYHLQRFCFSASILVVIFFFFYEFKGFLMTSLQVIVPVWHNPLSSRKGQNLKQTVLFQINVIYYFKQLIHGLSIHVQKFKQGNAFV